MKKIWIILLEILLVWALNACGREEKERTDVSGWQEQYDLGMRYLEEGDYEEAIIAFTKAIEIDARQEDVYLSLADAYIASEQIDKAEEILSKALEYVSDPNKIERKLGEIRKQNIWSAVEKVISEWKESDMSGISVSSAVLCDIDADGIQELLITYMTDEPSGIYEKQIWAALYGYGDTEFVMLNNQKIGEIDYCDAMQARLFFSEQQEAFCIITNRETVGAYTGVNEFVSELYKISREEIVRRRYWSQNTFANPGESQENIIGEMKRVGISHMEMDYFSFGMEDADLSREVLLFQNTVLVEGDSALERQYQLLFSEQEEVMELKISDEESALIDSRSTERYVQEKELKQECRSIIQLAQRLLYGDYGVAVDYESRITGPHWPDYDDYWYVVSDYSSMEEVEAYVRPLVSDEIYNRYFEEENYMVQDGKLYFRATMYEGRMNVNSLEIENIDGDIYYVSVDEYLGADIYITTNVLKLQKKEERWVLLDIETDQIDKGFPIGYIEEGADFVE